MFRKSSNNGLKLYLHILLTEKKKMKAKVEIRLNNGWRTWNKLQIPYNMCAKMEKTLLFMNSKYQ